MVLLSKGQVQFIIKSTLTYLIKAYKNGFKHGCSECKAEKALLDYFAESFDFLTIQNKKQMEEFVLRGAAKVGFKTLGYSIFAINLIIKQLSPFIDPLYYDLLDAPLNKDELKTIGAGIVLSDLDDKNYSAVMDKARNYATSHGFKNLYLWELNEFNK